MGSLTPTLDTSGDGESGVWVYVCDTNYRNGQYALVGSNTATAITVTPDFSTTPVAGWYWYLGGINPTYTKWIDYGSPQHKQKLYGVSVTVKPEIGNTGNNLVVHGMQDLYNTIRTSKINAIGGGADTVQTFKLQDKESTQCGISIQRPSSLYPLNIEDITLIHSPRV
jgi:hypothetical protein